MTYRVRLWVEDEIVRCCSGVCTEQSCPRVGICKETEIKETTRYEDCKYAEWLDGMKCLGLSVSQDDDEPCDQCKVCPHYESYEDEDGHEDYSDTLPCGCCACCGCSCDDERDEE